MSAPGLRTNLSSADARPLVCLLGGFSVRVGGNRVALPKHSRRVLAYLCLDKAAEVDCDRGILAERLGRIRRRSARAPAFAPHSGESGVNVPHCYSVSTTG